MKFLILHGSFGTKDGNWFPELKEKLMLLNQEVILEQFPIDDYTELEKFGDKATAKNQTLDNWLNYFESEIYPKIKRDKLVIVAHSLGPLFALHVLEKFELNVDSAIFVAPFLEIPKNTKFLPIHIVNKSFYKHDFYFKKLKNRIGDSYVIYSDNDPYVDAKYAKEFANELDSSLIKVKGGGHMSSSVNLFEFPLVLELCKSRINLTLYQKYLAHLSEYHPTDVVIKGKDNAIILPSSELVKEGTFHFRNLEKGGLCTLPAFNIDYWETESVYMKEGRRAAKRVSITRIYILNSKKDLEHKKLKEMAEKDIKSGIEVKYCLYDNIKDKYSKDEIDFGIWDDNYVCTVTEHNGKFQFEIDSREETLKDARDRFGQIESKSHNLD